MSNHLLPNPSVKTAPLTSPQTHPLTPDRELVPDPSDTYERSHPEHESVSGTLYAPQTRMPRQPDHVKSAVSHRQDASRSLNSYPGNFGKNRTAERSQTIPPQPPLPPQPTTSMYDDLPIDDPPVAHVRMEQKRYLRTGGKGGTPNAGEPTSKG